MEKISEVKQSFVVGYLKEKNAVEIQEIVFNNGHKVKYVSGQEKNYPKDKEVFVYLSKGILPIFTTKEIKETFISSRETTHTLWGVEDGEILKPINNSDIDNGILFESSNDNEDGTYPLIMHYVSLFNKMDKDGVSAWLNRISNKNKLDIDYGVCRIVRDLIYDSKAKLIFKEPVEILLTTIGDRQIIEKVTEIEGEFTFDWYWTKNGRQNKIVNGFEIWFNIEKYLK